MNRLGRNDPCWCGSGSKFKKCHLDREREPRPSFAELLTDQRATQRAMCMHPDAPTSCEGRIIRAHTVQKSGGLSRIARDGHVYAPSADLGILKRTGGRLEFRLLGINEASTFTGFCAMHDREAFRPIETERFTGSQEQLFLHGYRPFCRELYAKLAVQRSEPARATYDRGLSEDHQRRYQLLDSAQTNSTALAVRDQLEHKRVLDHAVQSRDFSAVRGLVIEFDAVPSVLVSAQLFPDFDFQGRTLQDFATLDRLDLIAFTVIPHDTGGIALFTWTGEQPACDQLVKSLLDLPEAEIPDALLRFTFEYFENTFIAPEWWEALAPADRAGFENRIQEGADLFVVRKATCLTDDGRRTATWKVRATHRLGDDGSAPAQTAPRPAPQP